MTTHAVIFLYYPPTVLNVLTPLVFRIKEERRRHVCSFRANTAEQKSSQGITPLRRQIWSRHAQTIFRIFLFPLIVDRRLSNLVLEKSFMVVPGFFFLFRMQSERISSLFCALSE